MKLKETCNAILLFVHLWLLSVTEQFQIVYPQHVYAFSIDEIQTVNILSKWKNGNDIDLLIYREGSDFLGYDALEVGMTSSTESEELTITLDEGSYFIRV